VGEPSVELVEQTVQHNKDDIRDLTTKSNNHEERIYELESNQQLTNQSISHLNEKLGGLQVSVNNIDAKLDEDRENRQREEKIQLQNYKETANKTMIRIAVAVIGTVVGGVILQIILSNLNII